MRLQIADDSMGFDTSKLNRRSADTRPAAVEDRVEGLGGALAVQNGAERGMVMVADLPIRPGNLN